MVTGWEGCGTETRGRRATSLNYFINCVLASGSSPRNPKTRLRLAQLTVLGCPSEFLGASVLVEAVLSCPSPHSQLPGSERVGRPAGAFNSGDGAAMNTELFRLPFAASLAARTPLALFFQHRLI